MPTAKHFLTSALAAALALAISGFSGAIAQEDAASHPEQKQAENKTGKKKRRGGCAFRRSISGFSVIDRQHFVLDAGRDFLVTLSPGCHNLTFNTAIAIKSTPAAGICVERGDRVILDHGFTCFIRNIEPVQNRKEAKTLVEERKKAAKEKKGDR